MSGIVNEQQKPKKNTSLLIELTIKYHFKYKTDLYVFFLLCVPDSDLTFKKFGIFFPTDETQ